MKLTKYIIFVQGYRFLSRPARLVWFNITVPVVFSMVQVFTVFTNQLIDGEV